MQFLFGIEFSETPWEQALVEFWHMDPLLLSHRSFEKDEEPIVVYPRLRGKGVDMAKQYAGGLISGICEYGDELDHYIIEALDHWKPERVGRIEMAIMRIALYEMRFHPETPGVVIISEAVQLANAFGDRETPRFINGLLNRLLALIRPDADELPVQEPIP